MNSFERDGMVSLLKEISGFIHNPELRKKIMDRINELENLK